MAVFHILQSRPVDAEHSEFTVSFVSGSLSVGEQFRCNDTHHPVEFRVLRSELRGEHVVLFCEGRVYFDEQFSPARVDTEQRGRPAGFRFLHFTPGA